MKIKSTDVRSIMFAVIVLLSLAEQTIDEGKRIEINKHKDRLRKLYLILLNAMAQGLLTAEEAVQFEITDNSELAKGVRAVCPSIESQASLSSSSSSSAVL